MVGVVAKGSPGSFTRRQVPVCALHVCVNVYVWVWVCVYMCVWVCGCECVGVCTCANVWACVCIRVQMCGHVCMCGWVWVCVCVRVCECVWVYPHTHKEIKCKEESPNSSLRGWKYVYVCNLSRIPLRRMFMLYFLSLTCMCLFFFNVN